MKSRDSILITWPVAISILCLAFATNGQEQTENVEKETERSFSESLLSPSSVDDGFALSMMHALEEESDLESRRSSLITIRPQVWFPEPDGLIILQDAFGFGTNLDLDTNLGINDSDSTFAYDVQLNLGGSVLRISGFSLDFTALENSISAFTFGDLTVSLGDLVDTEVEIQNIKFQYGTPFFNIKDHGFEFGPSIGFNLYEIKATVVDVLAVASDSIDEEIPIPIVGLHLALPLGDFLLDADISGLIVNIENYNVNYIDLNVSLSWEPIHGVGIFAGYRMIEAELDDSNFTTDVSLQGPYFGGELRF